MEELATEFSRRSKERGGLRYPEDLRQLAVEYACQAREQGHSRERIAGRLGLSESSLVRWIGRVSEVVPGGSLRVHEVKVTGAWPSPAVLVMPSGARVEGLSVSELVEILGALG
jgi:transposase-like protein